MTIDDSQLFVQRLAQIQIGLFILLFFLMILHENFIMETRFKFLVRQYNTVTNDSFIHDRHIFAYKHINIRWCVSNKVMHFL